MSAGMHFARGLAAIGQVGHFIHRQAIHIGAQSDALAACALADHTDHAGDPDLAMHFNAPAFEFLRHNLCGADLLQTQFGMDMEITPDRGHFVLIGFDNV